MINIAVCDDDFNVCNHIYSFLTKHFRHYYNIIEDFSNGEELIKAMEEGTVFNLIFLDIEMQKMDGIMIGKKIRSFPEHRNAIIIFITSYNVNPSPIVDIHPFAYLQKPFDMKIMYERVQQAFDMLEHEEHYVILPQRSGNLFMRTSEIYFLESMHRKCLIHLKNETIQHNARLAIVSDIIEAQNPYFVRIHASFSANLHHLDYFYEDKMMMSNGISLPIGRKYKKELMEHYQKIFIGNIRI